MSWLRAAQCAGKAGDLGDVFDEDADESLLVQREWRSHMQRRVKVNPGGGGGAAGRRAAETGAGGEGAGSAAPARISQCS